ncbi:MAG: exodeoxyribonuclease VII small subunit [Fibrobacteraceae bacterium]|jgi:exodeoxyribonuclease VII small subunit|nr:exodeoxyribonuclease VII small subunit [Fibrobacteraceae bacterium]MBQ5611084.1 exodeoxyribonuclease VII small subunit [Fibrobacteraceae bacterium]MEE0875937.1 exodeoxyribonuclease VII small subunit [Fibrobacteraceae bacterium]
MSETNLEYKKAMSRLEEILQKIDQSEMGIDELASQVEEATLLLRQCRRILTETEEKVQQSLRTLDGELDSNV